MTKAEKRGAKKTEIIRTARAAQGGLPYTGVKPALFRVLAKRAGGAACFWCDRPLTTALATRDHLIPRAFLRARVAAAVRRSLPPVDDWEELNDAGDVVAPSVAPSAAIRARRRLIRHAEAAMHARAERCLNRTHGHVVLACHDCNQERAQLTGFWSNLQAGGSSRRWRATWRTVAPLIPLYRERVERKLCELARAACLAELDEIESAVRSRGVGELT